MADRIDGLRGLLRRSGILGGELDTRYRVLGLTVEDPQAETGDARRQVLLHPVASFAASLRERTDDGITVLTFSTEQLPAVLGRFEGAVPDGDPVPTAPPDRSGWPPEVSLEGSSSAPDGRRHHLALAFATGTLRLDLHATFDEFDVRDPEGNPIEV